MFEDEKPFVLLKLPFCEQNELKSKDFIKKFHNFTNNNFRLAISWKTRKIKSLFKIKDKNLYPACKIYYGECGKCGDGRNITILVISQNQLNTLKEILIMYLNGRFYAQLIHRNILGRTKKKFLLHYTNHH